jgi:hypothetical protein
VVDIIVEVTSQEHVARLRARLHRPIEPLHPGTGDPALAGWYRVIVSTDDAGDAGEIAERLLQDPEVKAAYVKPPEGTP